ncbi:cell division protein ZipA [Oceanospirillum sp.]|uniref:cell division protein ZipA n=1 Tax=Oceanospirillum sp. TaxID=2021254 RepID=UPI003A93ED82
MGLREWLMVLGGLILLLIIADGIRRMRKADAQGEHVDEEERVRQEQLRRELPSGGARVIKSHDVEVFDDDPIPVLRHEVEIETESEAGPETEFEAEPETDSDISLHDESYDHESSLFFDEQTSDAEHFAETNDYTSDSDDAEIYSQASEDEEADIDQAPDFSPEPDLTDMSDVDDTSLYDPELAASPELDYSSADNISDVETSLAEAEPAIPPESEPTVDSVSDDNSLHVTAFDPVDDDLSDLEPLEPLEKRFAAAKARRLEEEQKLEQQKREEAEVEAAALEESDPVKAAVRRIQGKHTGPRPLERMKQQAPVADDISLAERQYRQQQEMAHKADVLKRKQEQANAQQASVTDEQPTEPSSGKKSTSAPRKFLLSADEERGQIADADELLMMHVKCKDERGFHGAALLHIVMQCGMQIGAMGVFHRFVKTEDGPQIQFSMLSSVAPGVFDIEQLDDLYIPSVSFVMGLPAPGNSQECFNMMLETAKVIVRHMSGELRDENRSVMTPQTIEHYKQRIQEFERRKQLARMR